MDDENESTVNECYLYILGKMRSEWGVCVGRLYKSLSGLTFSRMNEKVIDDQVPYAVLVGS